MKGFRAHHASAVSIRMPFQVPPGIPTLAPGRDQAGFYHSIIVEAECPSKKRNYIRVFQIRPDFHFPLQPLRERQDNIFKYHESLPTLINWSSLSSSTLRSIPCSTLTQTIS